MEHEDTLRSTRALRASAAAYRDAVEAQGGQVWSACADDRAFTVCALACELRAGSLAVPALETTRLAVAMTPARIGGGIDGDRHRRLVSRRHALFLTPAGEPSRWRLSQSGRAVAVLFAHDAFAADSPFATLATPALLNFHVRGIGALADELQAELRTPSAFVRDAVDALARLLLIRVARHLDSTAAERCSLTPRLRLHLRDYVMEHIGERILVAELAREAGLHPNRFAAAFTEQTGVSPHVFVLSLRVQRAAELLARTDASLVDIAVECGFASQQHMSNAIRRHLRLTPSQLRAGSRRAG